MPLVYSLVGFPGVSSSSGASAASGVDEPLVHAAGETFSRHQ
jgi:hypothetical protein